MKKEYASPIIEILLTNAKDIFTASQTQPFDPSLDDEAIGGAGYDSGGWT